MTRCRAMLTLLAVACSEAPEPTSAQLVVAGAVEAVVRIELRLVPAGGSEPAFAGAAWGASPDGTWRVRLRELSAGSYRLEADAVDDADRVLQHGSSDHSLGSGHHSLQLQLSPVDCAALDCGGLTAACTTGTCDASSGRCVAQAKPEGTGCDDGDACTGPDGCMAGACVGAPIDADGDGVPPPECAVIPELGDCDDADFTVAPGASEACDGKDNDCDGQVDDGLGLGGCYTGPAGTEGVGGCRGGWLGCDGSSGRVRCMAQQVPRAERLHDRIDNDCDGDVDEPDLGCLDCGEGGSIGVATLADVDHDVIVALVAEGEAADDASLAAQVAVAQAQVLGLVAAAAQEDPDGIVFEAKHRYQTLYAIAASANLGAIGVLMEQEQVAGLTKDVPLGHTLNESVPMTRADEARREAGTGGADVAVAVVDTGVDYTHPAFGGCDAVGQGAGCRVVAGWDFVDNDADPMDPVGQGTLVAGVAAGQATDGCPGGVAPGASIAALRVLDSDGNGRLSNVLAALDWVYTHREEHGIRVVNVSAASAEAFGDAAACDFDVLANAIARLGTGGILTVAAAGNGGDVEGVAFPACASGALSVGAVYDQATAGRLEHCVSRAADGTCERSCADLDPLGGQVACYSNGGANLDLVAPGERIAGPQPGGGCAEGGGTSLSAPHVAGAAALLWAEHPEWTRDELREHLLLGGALVLDRRTDRPVPALDVARAREQLSCEERDGRRVGLRCPREEATCEGDGGACPTGQPGVCAAGIQRCDAGGNATCVPNRVPMPERCNGLDDDCDAETDEDAVDHGAPCGADALGACAAGTGSCSDDGVLTCVPADPGAETCNGLDDDCDGQVDEERDAAGCEVWYHDADGDGFGVANQTACQCGPSGTFTAQVAGDCQPVDAAVFPGAQPQCVGGCSNGVVEGEEVCDDGNGVRNDDCDGCLGAGVWRVAGLTADGALEATRIGFHSGAAYLAYSEVEREYPANLIDNPSAADGQAGWTDVGNLSIHDEGRTDGSCLGAVEPPLNGEREFEAYQDLPLGPWPREVAAGVLFARGNAWLMSDEFGGWVRWALTPCAGDECPAQQRVSSEAHADNQWVIRELRLDVPVGSDRVRVHASGRRVYPFPFAVAAPCVDDLHVHVVGRYHHASGDAVFGRSFDRPPRYARLEWESPERAGIAVRAQSSADGEAWLPWDQAEAVRQGAPLTDSPAVVDGHQHLRLRFELSTSDLAKTPQLQEFSVGYFTDGPP